MKVSELQRMLSKCDPNAVVIVDGYDLFGEERMARAETAAPASGEDWEIANEDDITGSDTLFVVIR